MHVTPRVATSAVEVEAVARAAEASARIAVDVESNGMFVYRAKTCVVQMAFDAEVMVLDALATPIEPLARALGEHGPVKIIHDVGFDARMLAESGIELGNVHDTSIAARMLGHQATGLASMLAAMLGVTVSKEMQHHDWAVRPFDERALAYLASDVAHLAALDDALWSEVRARGIEDEVLEETRYRIATAIESARTPDARPPYVRVKGIERAKGAELAIMRGLAEAREAEAERRDVPPHKVMSAEAMLAVARSRPATIAQLRRVRGAAVDALGDAMLRAVADGLAAGAIPEGERVWFERPRVAREVVDARRARESRLTAWRKAEAKRRGVDEQVVLPGHCLREIAERGAERAEDLAGVAGFGAFRVARDGDAIVRALTENAAPPAEKSA
jgi:ribonuclease D